LLLSFIPALKPQLEKPSPAVPSSSQSAHAKSALFSASDQRATEDALNFVLPPREWEEDGQLWRQQVNICQISFLCMEVKG